MPRKSRILTRVATAIAVAALVAGFWFQGERFIRANGPTYDEAVHLAAGYSYWATGKFGLNIEDPPLAKLAWALPVYLEDSGLNRPVGDPPDEWLTGNTLLFAEPGRAERLLTAGRRVNLLFGTGVVLLSGWWAFRAWNSLLAGLTAAALAAADPTLTALSGVLSTDVALTLFAGLTWYFVWEYAARQSPRTLTAAGVSLGLALGSKFSAVVVAASTAAGVAAFLLAGGGFPPAPRLSERLRIALTPAVRIGLIALLTLVPLYFVVHFPDWGRGLKQQLVRGDFGDQRYFFLGEVRGHGSVWYFPVALALKLPLGTTLLALTAALWPGIGSAGGWPRWLLVAAPPLAFVAGMTISGVDIGVRVVLPAVPAIYLLAARMAAPGPWRTLRLIVVVLGVTGALAVSLESAPHQLAYFTEPVGGAKTGIRLLGDSNLDWGQDLPALRDYMEREKLPIIYLSCYGTCPPGYYGIRYHPLPGWGALAEPPSDRVPADAPRHVVAISASNLQGIHLTDPEMYAWLRGRQPEVVLGGSIWVFDLTGDEAAIARLRALTP
jgi:hypothetical protein